MRNGPPAIPVEDLIAELQKLPAGSLVFDLEYAGGFDMNQDTKVRHLTGVNGHGRLLFDFSAADYWIEDEDYEPYDDDDDDDEPAAPESELCSIIDAEFRSAEDKAEDRAIAEARKHGVHFE